MNLDALTDAVWDRLTGNRPRALLIGKAPYLDGQFCFVREKPYEAVVLGLLSPGELLHMPSDAVCEALLENVPVYLWSPQPYRAAKYGRILCRELAAAEQHLKQLGVRPMAEQGRLVTAQAARELLRQGRRPDPGSRLTPLARDILEGKGP